MTTVSVLASPPAESALVDRLAVSPLERSDATRLYEAMFADVCRAIERSGADLVVAASSSADTDGSTEPLRTRVDEVLDAPGETEFRVREKVDRTEAIASEVLRLHEAGVTSAAVVEPSTPFLTRPTVDSAAMKLRSSEVVLGPAPDGRVYFASFGEPLDLRDRLDPPAIEGLAELAGEDHAVDFLPMLPVVETAADLPTAVALLRARVAAGRAVPQQTAAVVADLGLTVRERDGDLAVVRENGS